jgi:hypothetical protein
MSRPPLPNQNWLLFVTEIGNDNIDSVGTQLGHCLTGIGGVAHGITLAMEQHGEQPAHGRVLVHKQDGRRRFSNEKGCIGGIRRRHLVIENWSDIQTWNDGKENNWRWSGR